MQAPSLVGLELPPGQGVCFICLVCQEFFFFFTTLMVEGFSRLKSSYLFIYIYIFKLSRDVLEALKGLAVT